MSGEPAYCRALRLRQAAHCLLPSLEPSLPIDVRLGPPGRIGGSGAVCCGYDHIIWIRRIHGHAHEVAVLQSILGRTPRVRSIDAFKVPVAGGRVIRPGASGCVSAVCVSYGPPRTRPRHVRPPSNVRTSAPAPIATNTRSATLTSASIHRTWCVCGRGGKLQVSAEGSARNPARSTQLSPPLSERNTALGSVPA